MYTGKNGLFNGIGINVKTNFLESFTDPEKWSWHTGGTQTYEKFEKARGQLNKQFPILFLFRV